MHYIDHEPDKRTMPFKEQFPDFDNTMEPRGYIPPSQYDVLLSDVKHNDLVGPISHRLGIKYLEQRLDSVSQYIVEGVLFGTNCRPMVNLVVSSKRFKKQVNIIFMVDTVSPCLYVCQNAMESLGFSDSIPETFDLMFRGKAHQAVLSPMKSPCGEEGRYHDINLIGATFLSKTCAKLDFDYGSNSVKMVFE